MKLDAEKFYFKDSLYAIIEIDEADFEEVYHLIYFSGKIDSYCPYCQKETVFKGEPNWKKKKNASLDNYSNTIYSFEDYKNDYNYSHLVNRVYLIQFKCVRDDYLHILDFYVKVERNKLFKIGQNPPLAELTDDFASKKYKDVLSCELIAELNRASGLYSHGIGIGSFVYLRRIFESLIISAKEQAKEKTENWNDDNFNSLKMDKKIQQLKSFLPDFLVQNKSIYGILSKGVHELKEKDCLKIFPVIKSGIELILDEKLKKLEAEKKISETAKLINDIKTDLK